MSGGEVNAWARAIANVATWQGDAATEVEREATLFDYVERLEGEVVQARRVVDLLGEKLGPVAVRARLEEQRPPMPPMSEPGSALGARIVSLTGAVRELSDAANAILQAVEL